MTSDDDDKVELPLESVPGQANRYITTLPDGNRLALNLKGEADGEMLFDVRRADGDLALPSGTPVYEVNHFVGCGMTGPVAEGDHSCALCGGSVVMCGNSAAPFGGRACETCQTKRVLPRRLAIAQLMKKLADASTTPFAALEARDAVLTELLRPETLDALRSEDAFNMAETMKTITDSEIVAWDAGLERAAVRGSENFDGTPWDVKPCNQMLLLDGCMCVILSVGEAVTHAIALAVGGIRLPVKVLHAQIRRGQLIARAEVTPADDPITSPDQALRDGGLRAGMFWHDMAALQRFMEMEIVQRESAKLPRQAVRSAMRAGKPLPKVIVVRLRRVYQERQTGETDVEWHHRWMVRGHWRRQWYATTKEHKMIYIAPFIKGPEGAPFLPPRNVVKVVSR